MRIVPALLLSLLLLVPLHAQEEGSPTGELCQSLDGPWQFTTNPALVTQDTGWDQITVPGNWETLPAYATYSGKGWYRRSFDVPAAWKGKQVRLRFEAVNQKADVTLNGQSLGNHFGGYTPFEFDVTSAVKYGETNTVTVCADNTYHRGAWWPWGGISRSVALIANNDARIVWQHIRSEPDLAAGTAHVTVSYLLHNSSATAISGNLEASITYPGAPQSLATQKASATLTPKGDSQAQITFDLPAGVHLWDFDHPNLYTLTTTLQASDKTLHALTDNFGIRKVEVTPDGMLLNGEHIRVAGFNRVADSYQCGNTEPDSLVHQDVDLMKGAGAVMARLIHYPEAPNLLDYLDQKGMLIYCEIPVWGGGDPEMKPNNPVTKQWLKEMIDRDYNHPCIIGWSTGNELQNQYAYVDSMTKYVRGELDPSRLTGYISNTAADKFHNPKNDPVTVSDIAMVNKYGGPNDFTWAATAVRSKWPDKPIFFSEYGVKQIGASPTAKIPKLEESVAEMAKQPYVIGGALWTFNDYRNGFKTGGSAAGNREWGVVDVDRHPKAAYWQIRRVYSPVHSLTVASGTVTVQPRTSEEIPSYTLRGYQIAWQILDTNEKVTAEGKLPLPDLAPNAAAWSAPIPGAESATNVKVSLISPTGYDVDSILEKSGYINADAGAQ
jgi:beta-galactosidase